MNTRTWLAPILAGVVLLFIPSVGALAADDDATWQRELQHHLEMFGANNWIVVADASYPAQSSDGVDIITAGESQIEIVKTVLEALSASKLLGANVLTTAELAHVPEQDAQGITTYRAGLAQLLNGLTVDTLPQEKAIERIEETSRHLRVLVIKSASPLPYSSVFFQLTSSNWSADAEKRLRDSMSGGGK
jgi:L-fucose mutarotase/ribose pyranase (RbsD/FucU family)